MESRQIRELARYVTQTWIPMIAVNIMQKEMPTLMNCAFIGLGFYIWSARWTQYVPWYLHTGLFCFVCSHYNDVIMSAMVSRIASLTIVYSNVCSGADLWKHQSPESLAFVNGNSPVSDEIPAQRVSNTDVSIWWRHHAVLLLVLSVLVLPNCRMRHPEGYKLNRALPFHGKTQQFADIDRNLWCTPVHRFLQSTLNNNIIVVREGDTLVKSYSLPICQIHISLYTQTYSYISP